MTGVFSPQLNWAVKLPAKPLALARGYCRSMDASAIRWENLRLLVHQLERRGKGIRLKKDVAIELGMSASYLSQLLTGKKMGDDVARKIEVTQGLEHGWMDKLQTERGSSVQDSGESYRVSQSLRMDPDTIAASLKLVRLTFQTLEVEYDPEVDGVPVAFAYEYLSRRREQVVTPENLVDFRKALAAKLQEKTSSEHDERTRVAGSVGGDNRVEGAGRKAS
jgi:transcriptional regulator with XRE-family HTH domain